MTRNFVTLLSMISAVALFGCQEAKPKAAAPTPDKAPLAAAGSKPAAAAPAEGGDVVAGKKLFLTACANCHGPDGTGSMMRQMMPQIGDLTSPETHKKLDDAALTKLIMKGQNKMPAFESVFQPDQIRQIIAYARTLEKK